MSKKRAKETNPTIASDEEYLRILAELTRLAKRYSAAARKHGLDPEEVYGRVLVKIHKTRKKIPRDRGQAAYVYSVFETCLADEGKSDTRWRKKRAHASAHALRRREHQSEAVEAEQERCVRLGEIGGALAKLPADLQEAISILWDHKALGETLVSLERKYGCCPNTLRSYMARGKEWIRENWPHLKDLM